MKELKECFFSIIGELADIIADAFSYEDDSVFFAVFNWNLVLYIWLGERFYFKYSQLAYLVDDWKSYFMWFGVYIISAVFIVKVLRIKPCWIGNLLMLFVPYGILNLLFYTGFAKMFWCCLGAAVLCFLLQISLLFYRKKGRKWKNPRRTRRRIGKNTVSCACAVLVIGSLGITIADVSTSIHKLKEQKHYIHNVTPVTEKIFANNTKILEKFKLQKWHTLSIKEKEQACYELAQLEALYLVGEVDGELTYYITKDYLEGAGGFFAKSENRIVADVQYHWDRDYCIEIVTHEMYHYLQERAVEEGLEVDVHQLISEEALEEYRYDQKNYISIEEDYEKYYNQRLEIDARAYAEKTAPLYIDYIDNTLK